MNDLCLRDLTELIGGELRLGAMPPLGGQFEPVHRFVADSRIVQEGDLFWGLTGDNHDGSHFAEDAFLRGAAGAVVSGRTLEPLPGKYSIQVPDTRCALWQVAVASRESFEGSIISVAGGQSKSTTSRMIDAVLGAKLTGHAFDVPDEDALPLALAQLNSNADYAVFELPAVDVDSPLETSRPQIGVVTDLGSGPFLRAGADITAWHASQRLLDSLPEEGWAIINGDDVALRRMAIESNVPVIRVGRGTDCDLRAESVFCDGSQIWITVDKDRFRLPTACRHHVPAAMAAIAIGRVFDLPSTEIASGLERFAAIPRQCQAIDGGRFVVIDDTLDSGSDSLRMALAHLRDFVKSRSRVLVLDESPSETHWPDDTRRKLGELLVTQFGFELVVLSGRSADITAQAAINTGMPSDRILVSSDPDEIEKWLVDRLGEGDVVLVKGNTKLACCLVERLSRIASEQQGPVDLNCTGDSARGYTFEALPFASVLRETDASLPPG